MDSSAANRIGSHLTEVEIGHLLESSHDSQIVARANQHLGGCKSCQLLLEDYAAKPAEWKRFVSVMEEQNKHYASAPEHEIQDETNSTDESPITAPQSGRSPLNTVALIALVAILAIGFCWRFSGVIESWRNGNRTAPPAAPSVPSAPIAPSATPGLNSMPTAPATSEVESPR